MEKLQPSSPYQKRPAQVINLEKGKIPPQATDLEEVVLGAMMIDKKGVDEVIDILNPDVFFNCDAIDKIKKFMDSDEEIGLLMPKVLFPNGELQYLCKTNPTFFDLFARGFMPDFP